MQIFREVSEKINVDTQADGGSIGFTNFLVSLSSGFRVLIFVMVLILHLLPFCISEVPLSD